MEAEHPSGKLENDVPIGDLVDRVVVGLSRIGFAAGVSGLVSFLTFVLAIRWVSKNEIGTFVLFRTVGGLGLILADVGLGKAATRFIAISDSDARREIVAATLWARLLLSGSIALSILALESVVAPAVPSLPLGGAYWYLSIFVLALGFSTTCECILQGLHFYGAIAVAQIGASVINLALTCLFIMKLNWGVEGLIIAALVSETVSSAYQFSLLPRKSGFWQFREIGRKLLRFGFPLQLNSILTFLFRGIDPLLIGAYVNPNAVAHFNVAARIPERCESLLQAFIAVFYPHVSELFGRREREKAESVLNHSLRLLGFSMLFVTLAAIMYQDFIMTTLFTAAYLPSAWGFALLMISLAISALGNPLGTTLVAAGYPSLPAGINVIHTGIHLTASVVMIPLWGFMGAIYAAVLSNVVSIPVNVWVLRRKQIVVHPKNYLLPFGIFAVCWTMWSFVQADGLVWNVFVLAMFVVLSVSFGIVTRRDFSVLLESSLWRSFLGRRYRESTGQNLGF